MAVHRINFFGALTPDPAGGAYWQPASILDTNDLYPGAEVLVFPDTGTKIAAFCRIPVPKNYVGTAKIGLRWKTSATTGDVVWDADYRSIAVNEPGDPTTHQESVTVTDTADPTARDLNDAEMSLTSANLAVDDTLHISIARDGANGSDTLAAPAELIDAWLEYADA
jgi:hypothetical protein